MTVKPNMLKDDYTEKYYEENNEHNKDLFNPNKAALKPLKKPTLTRVNNLNAMGKS